MAIMLAPTSIHSRPIFGGGEQDAGQGHGQDLVGDAVDLPQRFDQGFPQPGQSIGTRRDRLRPGVAGRSSRPGRRHRCPG